MYNFYLYWAEGKINQRGQLGPWGEDNQGGGQDIPKQLAPRGSSCPGGKINMDTGSHLWPQSLVCV